MMYGAGHNNGNCPLFYTHEDVNIYTFPPYQKFQSMSKQSVLCVHYDDVFLTHIILYT